MSRRRTQCNQGEKLILGVINTTVVVFTAALANLLTLPPNVAQPAQPRNRFAS
jgi:hypothetical protein